MLSSCRRSICRVHPCLVYRPRVVLSALSAFPSIPSPRTHVATRHARLLTTSRVCRDTTVNPTPSENNSTDPPSPPEHNATDPTPSEAKATDPTITDSTVNTELTDSNTVPTTASPKKKKKNKKKNKKNSVTPTNNDRKLHVFKGALEALQNVLNSESAGVAALSEQPTTDITPNVKNKSKKPKKVDSSQPQSQTDSKSKPESKEDEKSTSKEDEEKSKLKGDKKPKSNEDEKSNSTEDKKTKSGEGKKLKGTEGIGPQFKKLDPKDITLVPVKRLDPASMPLVPIPVEKPPVPSVAYGLDRVLFNPGVYHLQDPNSNVYNFDPYLSKIMPVKEFDFNALKQYITSSKDVNLINIAKSNRKKYTGSTSSMTSMLSHFHYLISQWRPVNLDMLSKGFEIDSTRFTEMMRSPAATFLHWKDGTYAIDADKEFDTANILSMLGKSMEKLLTLPKDEFEKYRHGQSHQITEEERNAEEAFHYTSFQDFMMRSQLDAYDPRVPGTGMFDLKTRAVITIRMDARGYQKGKDYEIRRQTGQWQSFEREYYDMIRAAFLKYSLQVRMGRMNGIFVAFHNTQRIFGFQYIPINEMDRAIHGTENTRLGDLEFKASLEMLNECLDRATKKWPKQSLRLHFETRGADATPYMYFFAEPVDQEQIDAIQNANKQAVQDYERDILGLAQREAEVETIQANLDQPRETGDIVKEQFDEGEPISGATENSATWEEVREMVEEAMNDDEQGGALVREAIEDALEQSGILDVKSSTEMREYVDALIEAVSHRRPSGQTQDENEELDDGVTEQHHDDDAASGHIIEEPASEAMRMSQISQGSPNMEPSSLDASQTPPSELPQQLEYPLSSEEDTGVASQAKEGPIDMEESTDGSGNVVRETASQGINQSDNPEDELKEEKGEGPVLNEEKVTSGKPSEPVESDLSVNNDGSTIDKITLQHTSERECSEQSLFEEEESDKDGGDEEDAGIEARDRDMKFEEGGATSSALTPLKQLVVRMAQRISERPNSNSTVRNSEDASKLKDFEQILGRLIRRSKADGTEEETLADTEGLRMVEPASTPDETTKEGTASSKSKDKKGSESGADQKPTELLALVLSVKNQVDGKYVTRPGSLSKPHKWVVEYCIQEVRGDRAQALYQSTKRRRKEVLDTSRDRDKAWYTMFRGRLEEESRKGRLYRAAADQKAKSRPLYVVDSDKPQQLRSFFPPRKPLVLQTKARMLAQKRLARKNLRKPSNSSGAQPGGLIRKVQAKEPAAN
ncbi:Pet127-domain-containing protein [Xylariaceae sp. FL0255]|nr:Pet127-domain-containing protein [Xylariaceae sp. FL0255]